eukprot:403370079
MSRFKQPQQKNVSSFTVPGSPLQDDKKRLTLSPIAKNRDDPRRNIRNVLSNIDTANPFEKRRQSDQLQITSQSSIGSAAQKYIQQPNNNQSDSNNPSFSNQYMNKPIALSNVNQKNRVLKYKSNFYNNQSEQLQDLITPAKIEINFFQSSNGNQQQINNFQNLQTPQPKPQAQLKSQDPSYIDKLASQSPLKRENDQYVSQIDRVKITRSCLQVEILSEEEEK